jgi:hypothetical protein
MRTAFATLLIAWILPDPGYAQDAATVFRGRPMIKVSEGGVDRVPEAVSRDRAPNLECVISQIGDQYYWASRENVRLVRTESGAFITFVAVNGSGYIRIVKPEDKSSAALMSPTEERFDYIEHLLIGLRTVTYFGLRQPS